MPSITTKTDSAMPNTSIFDEMIDRRASNSIKWAYAHSFLSADEAAADPLPMWVADSDFRTPRVVIDALHAAVEHGAFGYPGVPPSYHAAVTGWQRKRFGWDVEKEWIFQTAGVVNALKTAIQAFSMPGDTVLIQPPVYGPFRADPLMNGRHVIDVPLEYTDDGYRFDAQAFEAAIRPNTRLFILSHPHNPTGNVWSEDELRTMGEICQRHDILVISDEIHEDLIINPEKKHIPFASLGKAFADSSITCTASSKTFNLAGLQCANIIVPNTKLRYQMRTQLDRNSGGMVNVLGLAATEAAYTHGEAWLEDQLTYLRANHELFASGINQATSRLKVLPADSLYLAWMDCRSLGMDDAALSKFMLTKARVWLSQGTHFGPHGSGFMRVNLACPHATVDEAIHRITSAVNA